MNNKWFYVAFILFSACWVGLQTTSVYTAFTLLHHKLKMQEAEFETENMVTLTFSKEAWKQLPHFGKHEIEIDEKRFDIQHTYWQGETIYVQGVFDTWETAWLFRSTKHHPEGIHPIWLAFFYFEQANPFTFPEPIPRYHKIPFTPSTDNVLTVYTDTGFIPPEIKHMV